MNKLREQAIKDSLLTEQEIVDNLDLDEEGHYHFVGGEMTCVDVGELIKAQAQKTADAIIALLQPRLLTKDEANYIQSHQKSNSSCRPWKCGFYDCRRIKDLVLAKLKRIQEAK